MLLPITNVTVPSDDWGFTKLKVNKDFSEETLCFTAEIKHKPSGLTVYVRNDGHGGSNMYDFGIICKDSTAVQKAWEEFTESCRPALRASVANSPEEWLRTLYDEGTGVTGLEDSVVELFVNEELEQKSFGRKRGAVVRPDANNPDEIYTYKVPADQLKGKVAGEYWDKSVKNWVSL